MPAWTAFAVATAVLTAALLYVTHRSRQAIDRIVAAPSDRSAPGVDDGSVVASDSSGRAADPPPESPTPTLLLVNVTVSQGLALASLAGIAWVTAVPPAAFGLDAGRSVLWWGGVAGVTLYAANEAAAALGARIGVAPTLRLREAMAPTDAAGWAVLLGVTLPVVAVFEEALFRGALIGALGAGTGIDPWLLAIGSSAAFGLGHGAQGRLGIVVAGGMGLALAGVFVSTGSLLVVVVAHYVVNASEFVVHERLGRDPAAALERVVSRE